MQGKLLSYPENLKALKILISAKYGGHDISLDEGFLFGETNTSPQFLSKFPLGKVPCVELSSGQKLDESNSAAWLLAPDTMTGAGDRQVQSEVIRWFSLVDLEVTPAASNWVYPLLGILKDQSNMERGRQDMIKFLRYLNHHLRLKTWLVGERISLADITLCSSLLLLFSNKQAMDDTTRVRLEPLHTQDSQQI